MMNLQKNQTKKPKAAFVATVYRHLEAFHLPFMSLLQNMGYEVHAYACYDHGKQGVKDRGIICHDIQFSRSPFSHKNITALIDLVSAFIHYGYQLIHVHTPVAGIIGRLAGRIAHVPVVVYTAHGFHFYKGAPVVNWMLYYPLEKVMAAFTDYLITINQEDYQRAKKFSVRKQILYAPGVGLDLEQFNLAEESSVRKQKRNELGIKEEDTVISYVAELTENKNQMQLIKSIAQIVKAEQKIHCLIIGSGKEELHLKDQVKMYNLDKYIHFLGFRRDISELLAASDIIALLSKREGLPKSIMEAMAAGKPIMTTNVRGNRDLVINGENGLVVPVNDVEATTEALYKLITQPELRCKMGKNSLNLVQQYDIKLITEKMGVIYNQAIKDTTLH